MNISVEELRAAGFRPAGTVFPDAAKVVRVQIDWPVTGFVVYIMLVNHEFKKAGTTGRGNSTFEERMHSTFWYAPSGDRRRASEPATCPMAFAAIGPLQTACASRDPGRP